jgi:hypothetical protein
MQLLNLACLTLKASDVLIRCFCCAIVVKLKITIMFVLLNQFNMAKIISSLVGDLRGSIGGNTYSRNRYGAYIRQRVKPVNPNTVAQSIARSIFSSISAGWRLLTQERRDYWNTLTTHKGALMTPISGQALFNMVNRNLKSLGQGLVDFIDNTNVPDDASGAFTVSVNHTGSVVKIETGVPTVGTDVGLRVYASAPYSPGQKYTSKSALRLVKAFNTGDDFQDEYISSEYNAIFGTGYSAGMKITFVVNTVSTVNGMSSPNKKYVATIV